MTTISKQWVDGVPVSELEEGDQIEVDNLEVTLTYIGALPPLDGHPFTEWEVELRGIANGEPWMWSSREESEPWFDKVTS